MEDIEFVSTVIKYIKTDDIDIGEIEDFFVMGININKDLFPIELSSTNIDNISPLMFIVYTHTKNINIPKIILLIQLFVEYGANINLPSRALGSYGYSACTPLLWLLEEDDEDNYEIIESLLKNGANPFIQDVNDPLLFTNNDDFKYLIHKYRAIYHMQSRRRGNLTRRKLRTSRAMQRLHASRLPIADDLIEMISKRLSHMPLGPMDIQRGSGFSNRKHGRKGKRTKKRLYRYY